VLKRVTGIEPALSAWEVSATLRGLPADTLARGALARLTATDRELLPSLTQSDSQARSGHDQIGSGFTERRRLHQLYGSELVKYVLTGLAASLLFRPGCATVRIICSEVFLPVSDLWRAGGDVGPVC
jgi:hypothetical protein